MRCTILSRVSPKLDPSSCLLASLSTGGLTRSRRRRLEAATGSTSPADFCTAPLSPRCRFNDVNAKRDVEVLNIFGFFTSRSMTLTRCCLVAGPMHGCRSLPYRRGQRISGGHLRSARYRAHACAADL
eukprot:2967992-Pleurochrysis_carterae.AAC.2